MDTLNTLSLCMQGIISAGLIMRIIFCATKLMHGATALSLAKLMHEEDEAARYKRRIKNSVVMLIIAQLIFPIKEILISYLGNGY